ncbi:MAG TPA: hypothetical protein VGB63_15120 [Pedobacter sp.]|jgi:hypothetical protein
MRANLLTFLLTAPFLLFTSCDTRTSEKADKNTDTTLRYLSRPSLPGPYTKATDLEQYYNYEYVGRGVIEPLENIEFNISQIRRDKTNIILFEKGIIKGDKVSFELLDTIVVEDLNENMYIAYQLCRTDTIDDSEIIALVELEKKPYFKKIKKAWRADRKTRTIITIDTKNIDCFNEGYGAD